MEGKAKFLIKIGLINLFLFLAGCSSNIPGVNTPFDVGDGTIQVLRVEKKDKLVLPNGSEASPPAGYVFVLVTVRSTGDAHTNFSLIDSNGTKFQCGGLVEEKDVCYFPMDSKGAVLWYSDTVQIPLYRFLGENPSPTPVQ